MTRCKRLDLSETCLVGCQALHAPGACEEERCGGLASRRQAYSVLIRLQSVSIALHSPDLDRSLLLRCSQQDDRQGIGGRACPCRARKPTSQLRGLSCRRRGAQSSTHDGSHCPGGGHRGPDALPEDREWLDTRMGAAQLPNRPPTLPHPRLLATPLPAARCAQPDRPGQGRGLGGAGRSGGRQGAPAAAAAAAVVSLWGGAACASV